MSISKDGKVRLSASGRIAGRHRYLIGVLLLCEFGLSVILSISLAAHIIFPDKTRASAGTPMMISYEGRLTDSSGNALGGTGTPYCFRFSIYDSPSGGAKLWPGGTPATTMATTTDGIFTANIGSADTLTSASFDFSTTSATYLQVDVNTTTSTCGGSWESLSPRQQVLSSPYALQANNVYGSLFKTDTTNNRVQVGTGVGAATPVYLGLDVKNTGESVGDSCSINGLMWYNSATSHALICEGGFIDELGTDATTTIASITANGVAGATAGTVAFSNSNGVSFGINGNTITASVNAAGGNTFSTYQNLPLLNNTQTMLPLQSTSVVFPFVLNDAISGSYMRLPVTMSAVSTSFATTINTAFSGSLLYTFRFVIYSQGTGASSQSLQSVASASVGMSQQWSLSANTTGSQYTISQNVTFPSGTGGTSNLSTSFALSNASFQFSTGSLSNFTGIRNLAFPFASSLSAGAYWMVYGVSSTASTQGTAAITGGRIAFSNLGVSQINNAIGNIGTTLNASYQLQQGIGSFSTAGGGTTASLAFSNVSSSASHLMPFFQIIRS